MAILFSSVTATADDEQVEFLCAGIPREFDDLEGWTAFEDFLGEIDKDTEVAIHVESYLYGGEETYTATPEEVAYMQMRIDRDADFLSGHCDNIEDSDFRFNWSPDEVFGMEME